MARPKKDIKQYQPFESKESLPKGEYEEKVDKRGNKYMSIKKVPEPRYYLVRKDGGKHELIRIFRKFNGVHRRLVQVLRPKKNQDEAMLRILKDECKLPVLDR